MPKVVNRDAYRDELLSGCFSLFARYGYDKITMRRIAQVLGVSTGTLYHYFPNKQAIIKALFDWVMRTNVGDALNRVRDNDDMNERIEITREFWKEYGDYYQKVMLLAFDLLRNSSVDENENIFSQFAHTYKEAMVKLFDISYEFSEQLFLIFLGSVFHSILTPHHYSYAHTVDRIVDLIKNEKGLKKTITGKDKMITITRVR